ncbi:hypothetical protein DAPPUDRAFT_108140 [Daphnia pulex]|uniref:Uncharacterized protein n=2 Tax=Daphnia pulex TaxID=6669 RepID=E9GZ98_DAPPU|nr:hypothetical protein DAPPUDRAFT_108140 [Daphnia pulex]|eukprot:EFX75194.1 hypothetical protein DAPPUDRAFT_108140 [Daphnia pulex]
MWRYLVSCLVFISFICTPSNQSPQSSFFGWPLSETKETDSQATSNTPTPNKDVSQSSQLPAKDKLDGFEVVSPKPEILTNLPENVNSTSFNAPTLLQKDNLTSGLTNYLSDEISSFLTTSVVFLGAALGRDGCDLKAACLAGTLVPHVQGRDIAVV